MVRCDGAVRWWRRWPIDDKPSQSVRETFQGSSQRRSIEQIKRKRTPQPQKLLSLWDANAAASCFPCPCPLLPLPPAAPAPPPPPLLYLQLSPLLLLPPPLLQCPAPGCKSAAAAAPAAAAAAVAAAAAAATTAAAAAVPSAPTAASAANPTPDTPAVRLWLLLLPLMLRRWSTDLKSYKWHRIRSWGCFMVFIWCVCRPGRTCRVHPFNNKHCLVTP